MKFIVAVIRPHLLDKVREALDINGVVAMTVSDAGGMGRQKGHSETYRGAEYRTDLNAKAKLEIAVPDEMAGTVVDTIREAAGTGAIGDGKIFVFELEGATRIRTGETAEAAL